ncbi:MAG: alpha/beta hydrolase, partial [Candidatus Nanopelagicales bacterium]|nr:alpha/beta hydrolase [Candidatus Nanopelagicales bacterium]
VDIGRAVIGGLMATMALVACSPSPPVDGVSSASSPPPADLATFYTQVLTWSLCEDAECATLSVPVDYARPEDGSIDLAVVRRPAAGAAQGTLVVNPGGPGASGTAYARAADRVLGMPVVNAFDVVGFDPRGVGGSAPVRCASPGDLDELIDADATPDTPDEIDEIRRVSALIDCVAPVEGLLDNLSTADSARDLDVLRAALGQSRLDYLGVSYGTHLGATYAALFPDRVGHFVLDGPLPSGLDAEQVTLGQALGFENSLRRFLEDCRRVGDCPLGDDADTSVGLDRLRELLEALDARPAPTADPDRPLTEGAATYAILLSLYRVSDRPLLRDALASLVAGDGTPLQRLLDERIGRGPDGVYRDNAMDAFYAITCSDRAVATDVPAQVERLASAAPILGEYLGWGNLPCEAAGIVAARTTPPPAGASGPAPPMLVIATTHDPATPYTWVETFLAEIGSGVLLVRDGDGHTGYREGSDCIDEAVDAFLLDGVLPAPGTTCV